MKDDTMESFGPMRRVSVGTAAGELEPCGAGGAPALRPGTEAHRSEDGAGATGQWEGRSGGRTRKAAPPSRPSRGRPSAWPALCLAAACLPLLGGCADMDPWRQMSAAPASASSLFVAPARPAPPLEAARQPPPRAERADGKLTLAECIRIALQRNPATRSSWQSSRSAAAQLGREKSAYLPQVDLAASAEQAETASRQGGKAAGTQDNFDVGFSLRYLLFDGGARAARVRGAAAELLAANLRHNTTLQDVALEVQAAYYRLLAAGWLTTVAEQTVQQRQRHVELARARHQSGVVTRSDVLKAETEKAQADLGMVRARSVARVARGQLAHSLGLRVSTDLDVVDLPQDLQKQELADIERLLIEAAGSRPELRAALSGIASRRAEVEAAEARYLPAISAETGYGWKRSSFPPDDDEWSVGVVMSLPLFTGFDRAYQVRRAKAELAQAVADYERLLRGVELEVWTAYSDVVEADQAVEAARKFVASAEESARVAEGEYKSGAGSIIELIDAQTARTAAQVRLVQARLDWYLAMARFERAVGRTLARPREPPAAGRAGP